MEKKGEFLFESYKEALDFITRPTNYEIKKGIYIVDRQELIDLPTIKVTEIIKSDHTSTIVLFFKNSTAFDVWKFWVPDKVQQRILPVVSEILTNIDKRNDESKKLFGEKK